jgi:hypothetical protein
VAILVSKLIKRALQMSHLISSEEAPGPSDSSLAVDALNGLLGEWSSKRYINPLWSRWTVTPHQAGVVVVSSTLAPGAAVTIDGEALVVDLQADPMYLDSLTVELGPVVYHPARVRMPDYFKISVRDTYAPPTCWAWDEQQPTALIRLWPKPTTNYLHCLTGIPRISGDLKSTDTIPLDESYYDALLFNLVLCLYDYFPSDSGPSQNLVYRATSALGGLKQRVADMANGPVRCNYPGSNAGTDNYWLSPLNTVNTGF